MEIDEKKIIEELNRPKKSAEDMANEIEEAAGEAEMRSKMPKVPRHGDIVKGKKAKGFKTGYCPVCRMYVPILFLRFDDRLGDQTLGYACSVCDSPLVAMTKRKSDGRVLRSYIRPGAKPA